MNELKGTKGPIHGLILNPKKLGTDVWMESRFLASRIYVLCLDTRHPFPHSGPPPPPHTLTGLKTTKIGPGSFYQHSVVCTTLSAVPIHLSHVIPPLLLLLSASYLQPVLPSEDANQSENGREGQQPERGEPVGRLKKRKLVKIHACVVVVVACACMGFQIQIRRMAHHLQSPHDHYRRDTHRRRPLGTGPAARRLFCVRKCVCWLLGPETDLVVTFLAFPLARSTKPHPPPVTRTHP